MAHLAILPLRHHYLHEEGHAIGPLQPTLEVVGREEDRAPCAAQPTDEAVEHLRRLLVQAGVRLVEQKDGRIMQDGARDGEALHHPARVGAHRLAPPMRQPHLFEHLGDPLRAVVQVVHAREELQVLLASQAVVNQWRVRDEANETAQRIARLRQVQAVDRHAPRRRLPQRRQDAQERGLASAVGSEQRHRLARRDLQIDAAQHHLAPKRLGHPTRDDQRRRQRGLAVVHGRSASLSRRVISSSRALRWARSRA